MVRGENNKYLSYHPLVMAFLFAFGTKWCLLLRYAKDLYNQGNTILVKKGKLVVGSLDFSLTIYCRYVSFGTRTCSRLNPASQFIIESFQ